jgi:hypothetical protein
MAPYRSYVLGNDSRTPTSRLPTDFLPLRLLASRTFTFLVGLDKEPIDVHIKLLQSLSEPLDRLMNNGTMKESTERVAVLEDVEVDIFGLFAEFCYTHNYRAPPKPKAAEAVDGTNAMDAQMATQNVSEMGLPASYCNKCRRPWASTIPNGNQYCSSCGPYVYCVLCGATLYISDLCRGGGKVCLTCSNKVGVRMVNPLRGEAALQQRLGEKKYGAMGMSHDDLRAHLESLKPEDELSNKLVYHAKLYVFATMYMIQPLKDLCLHKLSRDLEAFDFKDDHTGEFAELFRYVYVNTSGNDDDTIGTGSELRDLVITYAAYKAQFLVENKVFLEVLEEGGEGASAFAVSMAKRICRA